MSIRKTECPFCGNPVFVESQWEGIDLDCPFCQKVFTLPLTAQRPPALRALSFYGTEKIDPAYIDPATCFTALKKYVQFRGRASRREYWLFSILMTICFVLLNIAAAKLIPDMTKAGIAAKIVMVAGFLLPALSVTIRRLHDVNLSGWWLLLILIPFFGNLIILIIMSIPSQLSDNKYGCNPNGFHSDSPWPVITGWLLPVILIFWTAL